MTVEGSPQVVNTHRGRAVLLDGKDDALFIDQHPLAGAATFTAEAIFRPDGGAFEQRWLHLAEAPSTQSGPTFTLANGPRLLFEIRVKDDRWYLDTFLKGPGYSQALIVPEKNFPVGRWYHVAQVYDGTTYRSFVNGVLQAEAQLSYVPQGPGRASIGTRIDRRDYFRGAILLARFTGRALQPGEFLKVR